MSLLTIGGSIGSPGIEALFFTRVGVEFLPYMYIALAAVTFITTLILTALLARLPKKRLYQILPLVLGLSLVLGRYLVGFQTTWIYSALWLGMYLLWTLQFLVIWGLASMVLDTRQAKRLFPLLAAAGILGSALGGFVTRPLVGRVGAENLLFAWALAFFVAVVIVRVLLVDVRQARSRSRLERPSLLDDVQRGYRSVRRSELMRWISLGAVLMGVLFFMVVFPFSAAVTEQFQDEDAIAGFLGVFSGAIMTVAFFTSLFIANRLFALIGFMGALLIFPIVYLLGFSAMALFPAFATIALVRFLQGAWRLGIADTAYQALFSVVPPEQREPARAFIDGVPRQAGVALAGVLLLVGEAAVEPVYVFGLSAALAALAIFATWRAYHAYRSALAQALRAGQPHVFFNEEEPFGGYRHDASAVAIVVQGMSHADPGVRRVSAEILGNLPVPEATQAMVDALDDPDPAVRAALLRSLTEAEATSSLLEVAIYLDDPEPEVRLEAVEAMSRLAPYPRGLLTQIERLLDDPVAEVRSRVAITILKTGPHPSAPRVLDEMKAAHEPDTRVVVLEALASWGDSYGWDLAVSGLEDKHPSVRRASAKAIASIDAARGLDLLIGLLGDEDRSVRLAAANSIGEVGALAIPTATAALEDPQREAGALLALGKLPVGRNETRLRAYASKKSKRAISYNSLWRDVASAEGLEIELLAHSLRATTLRNAEYAIQAIGLLTDPVAISLALENLESRDASQRANAIEILDSLGEREIVAPLLPVWEAATARGEYAAKDPSSAVEPVLQDSDPWLRACAALAAGTFENSHLQTSLEFLRDSDPDPLVREAAIRSLDGGPSMKTLPTLSIMERILFLQRVPMFSDLPPGELKQVAAIAWENYYTEDEVIARQGEPGDAMFIILDGEVKVFSEGTREELARRGPGEYVGEMAIISDEPRMASLQAAGKVRMLCIGQKEFEGIIRERPETSLALMRELSDRLRQAQGGEAA